VCALTAKVILTVEPKRTVSYGASQYRGVHVDQMAQRKRGIALREAGSSEHVLEA